MKKLTLQNFWLALASLVTFSCPNGLAWAGSTNILFLGDSLSASSQGLGRNLHLPSDYRLKVDAFCGYSPSNFARASGAGKKTSPCGQFVRDEDGTVRKKAPIQPLSELMRFQAGSRSADIVVIQLGTNLFGGNRIVLSEIRRQCEPLLEKILSLNPNAKILWMAPPKTKKYDSLSQSMHLAIEQVFKEFKAKHRENTLVLVDSRKYTDYPPTKPRGDGVHFNKLQPRWQKATEDAIVRLQEGSGVDAQETEEGANADSAF